MGVPSPEVASSECGESNGTMVAPQRKRRESRLHGGVVPVANWGSFLVACAGINGQLASDMKHVDAARLRLEYRDDEVPRFLRDLETLGIKAMTSAVPETKPRERAAWTRFLTWLLLAGLACSRDNDDPQTEACGRLTFQSITRDSLQLDLPVRDDYDQVCVMCGFNIFRSMMNSLGWLEPTWKTSLFLSDAGATCSKTEITEKTEKDPRKADVQTAEVTISNRHPAGKWPSSPVKLDSIHRPPVVPTKVKLQPKMDNSELLRWLRLPLDAVAEEVARHPSGYAEEEEVVDTELLRRIQELFDATFQDRSDGQKSAHKPRELEVVKVLRVDNRGVRCDYLRRREEIRASAREIDPIETRTDFLDISGIIEELDGAVNEKVLFHGTAADIAKAILFTRVRVPESAKDASHGRLYGAGAYFAESVTKGDQYVAADVDGLFPMVINRVVLGHVKTVAEAVPKVEKLTDSWSVGEFDSICGDRTDIEGRWAGYREFVIYDASQSMPEYLVWYRRLESGAEFVSERSNDVQFSNSVAHRGSRRPTTTDSRTGSPDRRRPRGPSDLAPADAGRRTASSALEGSTLEQLPSKREVSGVSTPSKPRTQQQSPVLPQACPRSTTPKSEAHKGCGSIQKQSPWK